MHFQVEDDAVMVFQVVLVIDWSWFDWVARGRHREPGASRAGAGGVGMNNSLDEQSV